MESLVEDFMAEDKGRADLPTLERAIPPQQNAEEVLEGEIAELHRQQHELEEKLRAPRVVRRPHPQLRAPGGVPGGRPLPRINGSGLRPALDAVTNFRGPPGRGEIRRAHPADEALSPPRKRRLLSAVVKEGPHAPVRKAAVAGGARRMFGALLLGTLEKFREEDQKLQGSAAFARRSDTLRRAEQRAAESSARLREEQRRQQLSQWREDAILAARLAAKLDDKEMELLLIRWGQHHTRLSRFIRTKAEPAVYFLPAQLSPETDELLAQQQEEDDRWRDQRRAEATEWSRRNLEQQLERVEAEFSRRMGELGNGRAQAGPPRQQEAEPPLGAGDASRPSQGNGTVDGEEATNGREKSGEAADMERAQEEEEEEEAREHVDKGEGDEEEVEEEEERDREEREDEDADMEGSFLEMR